VNSNVKSEVREATATLEKAQVRGTISTRFKDSEPPDTLTFRLRDGVPWRYLYDGTNSARLRFLAQQAHAQEIPLRPPSPPSLPSLQRGHARCPSRRFHL